MEPMNVAKQPFLTIYKIQNDEKFNDCLVVWKNAQELKTLVYNKTFIKRNFGKGKLNGAFTLGEATAEAIKRLKIKLKH